MIVVDTNILIYLMLEGPFKEKADEVAKKDNDWIVPKLWRSEFGNVLNLYYKKQLLTHTQTLDILEKALRLLLKKERAVDNYRALILALDSGCTYYDCEYIQLAYQYNVPLITQDKKLLEVFPKIAISMDHFLSGKS